MPSSPRNIPNVLPGAATSSALPASPAPAGGWGHFSLWQWDWQVSMPPTGNPPVPAQLPRSPSAPEGCQALGGCALPLTLHHPPRPLGWGSSGTGCTSTRQLCASKLAAPAPPLRPSWLNSTSPVRPAGHRWMRWALRVGSSSTLCAVCAGLPRPPSHARSPGQGRGHHALSARAWPGRDSSSPAQAVSPALPGPAQPLPSPHQCQTPGAHQLLLTHCPEVPCSPASSAGPVPCKGAAQRLCLPPRPGQQGSLRHPLPRGRTEPPRDAGWAHGACPGGELPAGGMEAAAHGGMCQCH